MAPENCPSLRSNGVIQKYSTCPWSRTATLTEKPSILGSGACERVRKSDSVDRALRMAANIVGSSLDTFTMSSRWAFSLMVWALGDAKYAAIASRAITFKVVLAFDIVVAPTDPIVPFVAPVPKRVRSRQNANMFSSGSSGIWRPRQRLSLLMKHLCLDFIAAQYGGSANNPKVLAYPG